jgi:hypothetical protein
MNSISAFVSLIGPLSHRYLMQNPCHTVPDQEADGRGNQLTPAEGEFMDHQRGQGAIVENVDGALEL